MKNISLVFMLFGTLNIVFCQVNNKTIKNTQTDTICKNHGVYTTQELSTFLNDSSLDFSYNKKLKIIIDCQLKKGKTNNKNMVIEPLLELSEEKYLELKKSKDFRTYWRTYEAISYILQKINNEKSFEIGLKYFSINKSGEDFSVDYVGHFGFDMYNTLMQMMQPEQRDFYQKLYDDAYLEFILKDLEDSNLKVFHAQFYPIIKQDWESGKIKLRKLNGDQ